MLFRRWKFVPFREVGCGLEVDNAEEDCSDATRGVETDDGIPGPDNGVVQADNVEVDVPLSASELTDLLCVDFREDSSPPPLPIGMAPVVLACVARAPILVLLDPLALSGVGFVDSLIATVAYLRLALWNPKFRMTVTGYLSSS